MLFFGVKVRMIYFMEVPEMLSICLNHRVNLLAHAIKKFRGRAGFKHESVLVPPRSRICVSNSSHAAFFLGWASHMWWPEPPAALSRLSPCSLFLAEREPSF